MQMKNPDVALSARPARHRHDAVLVQDPGLVRALERDRRETFLGPVRIDARLNHLDLDLVVRLVVHLDGAMPRAAVVVPASTYFRKFAAVTGARAVSTSISMSPSSVCTTTRGNVAAWLRRRRASQQRGNQQESRASSANQHRRSPSERHQLSGSHHAARDAVASRFSGPSTTALRSPLHSAAQRRASEPIRRRELELPAGEDVGSARVLAEPRVPDQRRCSRPRRGSGC